MKKQDKSDKVLVFGAGQVAGTLPEYFGDVVISKCDVTDIKSLEKEFVKEKPTVVLNTAAKTNIDWCEVNKEKAFEVNVLGALNIWELCKKHNCFMCHFSSGCIYATSVYDQIYKESDNPSPKCYYSWTKVWAENLLGKDENLLVLRPRVVVSSKVSKRNTIAKWLTFSHFIVDQNSITVLEDMLEVLVKMLDKRISGTFHIVNKGTISPLEVAYLLRKKVNSKLKIAKTSLNEINKNLIAQRVSTILDTNALETLGFSMPHVDEAMDRVVTNFKKNLDKAGGLKALEDVRRETKEKYSLVTENPLTYKDVN